MYFKYKKAVQALNFFVKKENGKINYLKAVKLVWLSDRVHLRNYGRSITNDTYVAMKNGPVPSGTKDIILKSGFSETFIINYSNEYLSPPFNFEYTSLKDIDYSVFSKTDLEIMEEIYKTYKAYNHYELSEYSHLFPEWKRFKNEFESNSMKVCPIILDDFFSVNADKLFSQDKELLELSREHFKETV